MSISNTIFHRNTTVRFISVGVVGAIIEIAIFSTLMSLGWGISASNFFAFHCAFILCFFLHYYYTHQKPYVGRCVVAGGFMKYALLMYAQLIIGTFLLWFLIEKLNWMAEIAKIVQIGTVTPISYAVQKLIIFRDKGL